MPADTDRRAAFERLYRDHYDRVLAYTLSRTDRDRALDATAEVFLVAWRRFDDVPSAPLPWLLGVARKVISGQRRSMDRRLELRLPIPRPGAELVQPSSRLHSQSQMSSSVALVSQS